ncbi:hypothetical protein GUJ93_ZPchr0013g37793 [Zizania palustris]|uniref:DUF4220 domain-containing protein n=1 Tax=Zizania palustris TaxID=103762 RepID=A0A8J5WY81_ZIZPA|nr:hypothetical protein GUJ93_ZPchr0013g37793 [Zizania palustris]
MGVSSALQWWDEWQLRVLVLSSLAVQCIIFFMAPFRKFPIRTYLRPIIWLAYLGSDALAIYALATLFNRHKQPDVGHADKSNVLEVVWAPVLLIHLGGQDVITAYNIEDNELWTRHVLTALSQITVAIYVFCKSWTAGDDRLLKAAVLLFITGVMKCVEKPWALYSASINNLVNSPQNVRRTISRQGKIDSIDDFVKRASDVDGAADTSVSFDHGELFVDLTSPCDYRLKKLKMFSTLDGDGAYDLIRADLADTFDVLYTKQKMIFPNAFLSQRRETHLPSISGPEEDRNALPAFDRILISMIKTSGGWMLRRIAVCLYFGAIALFHRCRRQAYNDTDVKVTYTLICCTAVLELYNPIIMEMISVSHDVSSLRKSTNKSNIDGTVSKPIPGSRRSAMDDMVYQYNLVGYFIRNKKHYMAMRIAGSLGCKGYVDQRWRMKSCSSSRDITKLVLERVKLWWRDDIKDVSSYWKLNDSRGQWTLEKEKCCQGLGWSLDGAFDESVLLWHLATDLCYNGSRSPSGQHAEGCCKKGSSCPDNECPVWCEESLHHKRAVHSREMSNYMVYLLFVNPEMLMAGTRRNLLTDAYSQLEDFLVKEMKPSLDEREVAQIITDKMHKLQQPHEEDEPAAKVGGLIDDAWSIAQVLLDLRDEDKMWRVIEGVWVEMLCFSAARCRGYLHAKGLGTGVEFLSYVWLLLHYMGMETLAEKLARAELPSKAHSASSSTFHVGGSASLEQGASPSSSQAPRANGAQHCADPATCDGISIFGEENV